MSQRSPCYFYRQDFLPNFATILLNPKKSRVITCKSYDSMRGNSIFKNLGFDWVLRSEHMACFTNNMLL